MYSKLSDHFSWAEATVSETAKSLGISNDPHPDDVGAIKETAKQMEIVRRILGEG